MIFSFNVIHTCTAHYEVQTPPFTAAFRTLPAQKTWFNQKAFWTELTVHQGWTCSAIYILFLLFYTAVEILMVMFSECFCRCSAVNMIHGVGIVLNTNRLLHLHACIKLWFWICERMSSWPCKKSYPLRVSSTSLWCWSKEPRGLPANSCSCMSRRC